MGEILKKGGVMIRTDSEINIGSGVPTNEKFNNSSLVIRGREQYARVVFETHTHGTTAWGRGDNGDIRGVSAVRGDYSSAFNGIIDSFQPAKKVTVRTRTERLSIFR